MNRGVLRFFLIFVACLAMPYFLQAPIFADTDDKFDKAWQHIGVKRLLAEQIGFEEAIMHHLDYNGFAIRLPDCLLVFDYDNETPTPQYDTKPEIGTVESLFTGVINPQEIKDESVVFFFSHEHPAEKILKLLTYKDIIKDVLFVLPEDVYLKHEAKIKELKQKDSLDLSKKDVFNVIKIVKPNHTYTIKGNIVSTPQQRAILESKDKTLYPGIEFIVETKNGLTIYHSGSLMCRHCSDLKGPLNKRDEEMAKLPGPQHKIISADTQKMRFVDGKMSVVDGEGADTAKGAAGLERLGLAIYSNPQSATGYMVMYVTCGGGAGLMGTMGWGPGGWEAEIAQKAREKEGFLDKDKFLYLRNPYFDADVGEAARLEYDLDKINEYFDQMAGNLDILQTLRNTTVRRYTEYRALVKEYCGPEVAPEVCDEKVNADKHGGHMFEVEYNDPSGWRGECYLFSPNYVFNYLEYFLGYCTSDGYPLFSSKSFLWPIFQQYGKLNQSG